MNSSPWPNHRRRTLLIVLMIFMLVGLRPDMLAPLGRTYVLFCGRFLAAAPFPHHLPPLLVAFVGLITFALVTGFAVALARQIVGQRQLSASLMSRRCEPDAQTREILARLNVGDRAVVTHETERVYAFCSGLFRPQMYLSRGLLHLLTPNEIEAVVRHELHHLRRRDPLWLFLGSLGVRLASVMPILATLDHSLRVRVELAADREVVAAMGVESLAAALIKVARSSLLMDHQIAMAAFSPTNARIATLLGHEVKASFSWQDLAISGFFLASLITLSIWLAFQSLPLPPECLVCPPF